MVEISQDIYWIGVNDRETHLFESIIPIPNGVSYNAYMIIDEKIALIDSVKVDFNDSYLDTIKKKLGEKKVDYIIINHMEPDHSGSILALIEAYPDIQIIGNKITAKYLEGFYGITENILLVKDNESISLGKHTLRFVMTPMLHWPETMMTYEITTKALFSGDAFGGFGALNGGVFDDEVNFEFYEDEMRRYYSNIIGKYGHMVQKAYKKLETLEIKTIASTHGLVWRDNPQKAIALYDRWSKQKGEDGVVIVYGSMYGFTKNIADKLARSFAELGIKNIRVYDSARTHASYILSDIWRYNTLVLGSSTYNGGMFPPMENVVRKIESSDIKNKNIGVFGTHSWSGESVGLLSEVSKKSGMQYIEPAIKHIHAANDQTEDNCKILAANMVAAMKNMAH